MMSPDGVTRFCLAIAERMPESGVRLGGIFATSGPGATNIVTPLTDAMMDSVPLVAFTGQVRTDLLGTDGFQEADTFGITMPIVKHSFMIQDPAEIPEAVHAAFYVAASGRPGPALANARRPVMYTGGGVVLANAAEELRDLCLSDRFPVTSTVNGLGAFPAPH